MKLVAFKPLVSNGYWIVGTPEDEEQQVSGIATLYKPDAEQWAKFLAAASDMYEACKAAIRYDDAIRSCANNPDKMASYCTAQGEDLDTLYADWMTKARAAIKEARGEDEFWRQQSVTTADAD